MLCFACLNCSRLLLSFNDSVTIVFSLPLCASTFVYVVCRPTLFKFVSPAPLSQQWDLRYHCLFACLLPIHHRHIFFFLSCLHLLSFTFSFPQSPLQYSFEVDSAPRPSPAPHPVDVDIDLELLHSFTAMPTPASTPPPFPPGGPSSVPDLASYSPNAAALHLAQSLPACLDNNVIVPSLGAGRGKERSPRRASQQPQFSFPSSTSKLHQRSFSQIQLTVQPPPPEAPSPALSHRHSQVQQPTPSCTDTSEASNKDNDKEASSFSPKARNHRSFSVCSVHSVHSTTSSFLEVPAFTGISCMHHQWVNNVPVLLFHCFLIDLHFFLPSQMQPCIACLISFFCLSLLCDSFSGYHRHVHNEREQEHEHHEHHHHHRGSGF